MTERSLICNHIVPPAINTITNLRRGWVQTLRCFAFYLVWFWVENYLKSHMRGYCFFFFLRTKTLTNCVLGFLNTVIMCHAAWQNIPLTQGRNKTTHNTYLILTTKRSRGKDLYEKLSCHIQQNCRVSCMYCLFSMLVLSCQSHGYSDGRDQKGY